MEKKLSQKKLNYYKKLSDIIQWGRKNPVEFVKVFFGIELLDSQAYAFMLAWNAEYVLITASRNWGKTTWASPYIMTRTLLLPNTQVYIMSGTASQSQETFGKIEKITKKQISSFNGLTDVFANELVKSSANKDGFLHNPASFEFSLYNGSKVNSLNSDGNSSRGKRSDLNLYDESGFMSDDYYASTTPFTVQDSNFKLGGDIDVSLEPIQLPKQQILISSASSEDTYFYKKYKEWSKKMIMGDRRYVVLDLDCETVLKPLFHGKPYTPLLKQSEIDDAMKTNKDKALREYYNKFTNDGAENQAVKRSQIIKNSRQYLPILCNNNDGNKFVFAYDPARTNDNSVIFVGQLYQDEQVGWKMRIVNGINFLDVGKKRTMQLRTPEQIDIIKQMLIDYNGEHSADYENIEFIGIDSGSGGAGRTIADYFMPNWKDSLGREHFGIIDSVENLEYVKDFPDAKDKMLLLSPTAYKVKMFDALSEMVGLGLLEFPEEYDNKGFINLLRDDGNGQQEYYQYNLSFDEEMALKNIDLAKEEVVNIIRIDGSNGSYRYDISPEKKGKMFDDRAYCIAMLAYILQLKRKQELNKKDNTFDYSSANCISTINY